MHTLALALGGMTVGELKNRITYYELQGWTLYEREMGPLHQALRFERAIAQAVAPFLQNVKPKDLMPWPKEPEKVATLDDFMRFLKPKAGKK